MEDKPKRSWKKRILIACVVVCCLIAVPVFILSILFAAGGVKPERRQPPKELLHVKPAANPAHTSAITSATMPTYLARSDKVPGDQFKAILAANPNQTAVRLYVKLLDVMSTSTVHELFRGSSMTPHYLNPKIVQWLSTHREAVDDMLKLAAAGGVPTITNEQAAAVDPKNVSGLPLPDLMMTQEMVRLLAAECRLRRERGDMSGAAECILASETLAQSVGEPLVISVLVSAADKSFTYEELKVWLEDSKMPDDTAQKLRESLEKVPPIDFRPSAELEYRGGRAALVDLLSGPYQNVLSYRLGSYYRGGSVSFWYMLDEAGSAPVKTFENTASAAFHAARIKASADSIVADFDTHFKKAYELLTPGRLLDKNSGADPEIFWRKSSLAMLSGWWSPDFSNEKTRGSVTDARLQLDLAGLDCVVEPETEAVKRIDPFTNAPLKQTDETTHTLIYSLGPDRVDQHGALSYDPTNGTFSAGDIAIGVPKN